MAYVPLIWPFLLDVMQLDTSATAAVDPDGAGPLTAGYDEDFREARIVLPSSGSARGASARREALVQVKAQIEPADFNGLRMMLTGRSPTAQFKVVLHFRDLANQGLVDPDTGEAKLHINDRLAAVRNWRTSALIQAIGPNPGLFCTQVLPMGFGLNTDRNLLMLTFEHKDLSSLDAG